MRSFLSNNRNELLKRCRAKVALRPARGATPEQLARGVPAFLEQLTRTLGAEEAGDAAGGRLISGASGGAGSTLSELGVSATAHGAELLALGYTVDQVVHDYGDLCQAITDLAVERDAPFSVDAFRTLNRCLDNAIADAVTEFARERDLGVARRSADDENERLGFLAHELRNHLHVAKLAFAALESGRLSIGGSTGAVLKRSLDSLEALIAHSLAAVRTSALPPAAGQAFSLAIFVADAGRVAELYATAAACSLRVANVNPMLAIAGNRDLLGAAVGNILQNAFKFTKRGSEVVLRAAESEGRVVIEVQDQCGGLAPGLGETMFTPFTQAFDDRRGLGLGLAIARQSVEADGGMLSVRDMPGRGCIFTVSLPMRSLE